MSDPKTKPTLELFNQCQEQLTALLYFKHNFDRNKVEIELRAALAEMAQRGQGQEQLEARIEQVEALMVLYQNEGRTKDAEIVQKVLGILRGAKS